MILTWHREYNDAVRELYSSRKWLLLDLAATAYSLPNPGEFFAADGIHFEVRGLDWIAAAIASFVAEQFFDESR